MTIKTLIEDLKSFDENAEILIEKPSRWAEGEYDYEEPENIYLSERGKVIIR